MLLSDCIMKLTSKADAGTFQNQVVVKGVDHSGKNDLRHQLRDVRRKNLQTGRKKSLLKGFQRQRGAAANTNSKTLIHFNSSCVQIYRD